MTASRATSRFDREEVKRRYEEERRKRSLEGRAATRDLATDEHFVVSRRSLHPLHRPRTARRRHRRRGVGAGLAGVVVGAELRDAGVERIRLIDRAGGIGGTWYWNRYPGVMCDVESYMYMPMLDEMGYVPTTRYAFGDEIRRHLDAIADEYDLIDDALFHTGVEESRWDEEHPRGGSSPPIAATCSGPATCHGASGSSTS